MANKAPAFQWYPKDCDTDETVRMMDDKEFGFYMRCLNHSWLNQGLPDNIPDIARTMGRTVQYVKSVWGRVGKCFDLRDGRYVNRKQEEQRGAQSVLSETNRRNAETRWGKADSQCDGSATARDSHANGNALRLHTASASPSTSSDDDLALLTKSLRTYMAGVEQLDPDAEIVGQVMNAGVGATAHEINDFLCNLYTTRSPSAKNGPRGYGWFPVVVNSHFGGRRKQ